MLRAKFDCVTYEVEADLRDLTAITLQDMRLFIAIDKLDTNLCLL